MQIFSILKQVCKLYLMFKLFILSPNLLYELKTLSNLSKKNAKKLYDRELLDKINAKIVKKAHTYIEYS